MAVFKNELHMDAKQHNSEMNNAAKSVKNYDKNIREAERGTRQQIAAQRALAIEMKNMKVNADGAKASVLNLVGAFKSGNFQNIGRDIRGLGNSLNALKGKNFSQLSQAFGVSGKQLAALGATAAPVAAAVGAVFVTKAAIEFQEEVTKSTRKVKEFLDLTDQGALVVRNAIKGVSDAWGKDFNDTLAATDALMSHFGLSGTEAVDLINKGLVAGADEGGRFYELISQYSGAFKDAGISASEFVAIISNTKSGLFDDAGMDSIVKATQQIRVMKKTTSDALSKIGIDGKKMSDSIAKGELDIFAALKQITDKMQEFGGDSKEVGDVLVDVFGKQGVKAGNDLSKAISELVTDLDEATEKASGNRKAIGELAKANTDLQTALTRLFGVSEKGWDEMYTQLKTQVIKALTDVINKMIEIYNNSITIRTVWGALIGTIKGVLVWMWEAFSNLGLAIMDIVYALENLANFNFDKVAKNIDDLGRHLIAATTGALDKGGREIIDTTVYHMNNRIEELSEDPSKATTGGRTPRGGRGSGGKGGKGGSKSGGKTEVQPKEGSLDWYKKKIQEIENQLNSGNYSAGETKETLLAKLSEYVREKKRAELELTFNPAIDLNSSTKSELEDQIKIVKEMLSNNLFNDDQALLALQSLLAKLEIAAENADIKVGLAVEPDYKKMSVDALQDRANRYSLAGDNDKSNMLHGIATAKTIEAPLLDKETTKENLDLLKEYVEFLELMKTAFKDNADAASLVDDKLSKATDDLGKYTKKYKKEIEETLVSSNREIVNSISEIGGSVNGLISSWGSLAEVFGDEDSSPLAKIGAFADAMSNTITTVMRLSETMKILQTSMQAYQAASAAASAQSAAQSAAEISANTGKAISGATASGAKMPFPYNIAAIAAGVAAVMAAIAAIGRFADGGIVKGSTSIGDYNLARVNGGEMILNGRQQSHLWNLINANNSVGYKNNITSGFVEFKIKGKELVGVLNNYNKQQSRI